MGLALAALGHWGAARAQVHAIQGAGSVIAGDAAIDNSGGTVSAPRTNVRIDSATAVINWTPVDTAGGTTPIDFLPANGLAFFYSQSDPNFTVLNRILPATTRPVGLNGIVQGGFGSIGSNTSGGNIWLYSPTGIVAGGNSRFFANGLILTANDIPFTARSPDEIIFDSFSSAGGFTIIPGAPGGIDFGPRGEIQFTAAAGSQASVTLLPGSLIQNSGDNAYTLLVAPSVVQAGTIALDGSVGIVAAEKARIIVKSSLFDIDVEVGTTVANAITHSGSTGANAPGDPLAGSQKVVLVATPQNTAISVLLGGNLGATAVDAAAADRSVILSGGYDYNDMTGTGLASTPDTNTPVNVQIGTSSINADLTVRTTGSIVGNPARGTAIAFLGNASLTAGTTVSLTADLDETITAAKNLFMRAPTSATLKLGTSNSEPGGADNAARVEILGDLTLNTDNAGLTAGADGMGGTSTIALDAGATGPLLTVSGNTLLTAVGTGAASQAQGGNGVGGTAQIVAGGGTLSLKNTVVLADGVGAAGTPAGSGTGGIATFTATDAKGYSLGDLTLSANGNAGGTAKFVNQGSAAAAANSRSVGNLVLRANGDASAIGGGAGLVQLSDLASGVGGRTRFASITAHATGLSAPAGKGALIEISGGTLTIDNQLDVASAGTVTLALNGGTIAAGGAVGIASSLGDILASGGLASLLEGQTVRLAAARDISGTNITIRSRGDLDLLAGRNLVAGTADAAGKAGINVAGILTIGNLVLRGPTPGQIKTGGDLTIGKAMATGLDVASAGGVLTVGGLEGFPGGLSGFLTASAPTISLGDIKVSGDIIATATGAVTIGSAQAGNTLSVGTPGTLTVNTLATGATVKASSGDLVINTGGKIGAAGTTSLIELTNNSSKRSYYGGAGNPAGYSLSAAEIGQLNAGTITLVAPQTAGSGATSPDVIVGDMTVTGGQLGAQGTFAIQTAGRVLIGGAVKFTGLGNGNTFAIRAGDLIVLDNQLGSVDLRGANDAPAGRIDFSAETIMAVSPAAQTALAGLTDPAAIDKLLGTNDGKINTAGVLRADSMRFAVGSGLYIQDTGAGGLFTQRRGFSVGAGGLAVSTLAGRTAPLIVINGQATAANGRVAIGLDTIPLVSINGQPAPASSGSRAGSTINGCDFTNVDDCRPPLTPDITLTRDRIPNPAEETFEVPSDVAVDRQALATPGIELQDIGRFTYEPLIDEPVTGSGNDDLWVPECDPGERGVCPPAADQTPIK